MTVDATSGMPPDTTGRPLRLRALDGDDLGVIAACLQDAILPIVDIAFDADAGRFAFVANRFRWEASPPGTESPGAVIDERVNAGVVIQHATAVKVKRIDRAD